MATDPVCFAVVDEDTAEFTAKYKGTVYCFCTNYCRKQFIADPKKYTRLNTNISLDQSDASC